MSNVYRQNDTFRLVSSKLQIDVLPKVFANAISRALPWFAPGSQHHDTSYPSDGLHHNLGLRLANLPQTKVICPTSGWRPPSWPASTSTAQRPSPARRPTWPARCKTAPWWSSPPRSRCPSSRWSCKWLWTMTGLLTTGVHQARTISRSSISHQFEYSGTNVGVNGQWVCATKYTPVGDYVWIPNPLTVGSRLVFKSYGYPI